MRTVTKFALAAGLAAAALPANASQPSSKNFGPWSVTSLSSASGDGSGEDDGPFFWLAQQAGGVELKVDWKGHKLAISIVVENCSTDDDFFQTYDIPNDAIYRASNRQLTNRMKADFATWIAQAEFVCENDKQIKALDLRRFDAAASYFIDRIR